jgi:sortase A
MRKYSTTFGIIIIFLLGLIVLLYPFVSAYINSVSQSRAIESYREAVTMANEKDLTDMWEAAYAYNAKLRPGEDRYRFSEKDHLDYLSLLNLSGAGVMGTLEIELIGVRLPIYHGTSEGVLQVGAGHFEGTSLPVGGKGAHAAITGHRGLPSSTLLTHLERLITGDIFTLHILDQTLYYQVDQIRIVEPDDLSLLELDPENDYCTMITCTPYGVNSHRLLVRGSRVDGPQAPRPPEVYTEASAVSANNILRTLIIPLALILPTIRLIRWKRKQRKQRRGANQ